MKAKRSHQDGDFRISEGERNERLQAKVQDDPRQLRSFPYTFVRDSPLSNW